jgi:hypothetical protein
MFTRSFPCPGMQAFLCLSPNREQLGTNTGMIVHVRGQLRVSKTLSQMKIRNRVKSSFGFHGRNKPIRKALRWP